MAVHRLKISWCYRIQDAAYCKDVLHFKHYRIHDTTDIMGRDIGIRDTAFTCTNYYIVFTKEYKVTAAPNRFYVVLFIAF